MVLLHHVGEINSFRNKMCGKNVYSSWPFTLKKYLIWQDLIVLVSLPLHHIQLFLIQHSEAKLINILQVSSKDVKKLAVAKEGCQSQRWNVVFRSSHAP